MASSVIDATDFGYVSMLRDQPSPTDNTWLKVGGYCVVGTATSSMNPGDVVIADSAADDSYKTVASANSTSIAGFVVAGLGNPVTGAGMQWDFNSAITTGTRILVLVKGVVLATASAAITRATRVGTSTTAGRVATTSTQDAKIGIALQTAVNAGDQIRVLV